ncbi:MAG: sigma-70 family RNA polymerase sigma factor [Terrimicrobiaceae bacterium]
MISFVTEDDPPPDDVELMLRARDGDLVAFEQVVRIHQHAVFGTAAKMLGSESDAEDIAQMVFVRAWKSAHRYVPTAKVSTWLMTITRNLVFNECRRRKTARLTPLEAAEDHHHIRIADPSQRPADQLAHEAELVAAVDAAIAALPEKARMAVILRRYEEKSYEEIADILDLSLPAVKSLLFRAREELKERLTAYLKNP